MRVNPNWLVHLLSVVSLIEPPTQVAAFPAIVGSAEPPKRTIAGVSVIDTPLVRAAQDLARQVSSDYLYKHVMRGWLFGALILSHNATLAAEVDLEAHAVAALLHDLGVAEGSAFVSADRRFEVDGAVAARDFLVGGGGAHAAGWDGRRVQLVWDAVALHTQRSIARYKEPAVAVTSDGIWMEFFGTDYGVTQAEYDAVTAEFPQDDFLPSFNTTLLWLAETKPVTTYDTWQQPWGDWFVANYSAVGHRAFDAIAGIHADICNSK